MIVYCNGDSFFAGDELGDDILTGHPGYAVYYKIPKYLTEWIQNSWNTDHSLYTERKMLWQQIVDLGKQRAFPNKLSNLLNIPVINNSHGGASMDRIVRTTITDLIELKKTTSDIVAIIGTAPLSRSEVSNCQDNKTYIPDSVGDPQHWISINAAYIKAGEEDTKDLIYYINQYTKNYHMLFSFYKNVMLLQEFCKSQNIALFWVATDSDVTDVPIEQPYQNSRDLNNFQEHIDFKYTLSMYEIARELMHEVRCPSGHFSEKVHDEIAAKFSTMLKEKFNV